MLRHQLLRLLVTILLTWAAPPRPSQAQWRVDGAPICTADRDQSIPAIIPDGQGGAILTWQDYRGWPTTYHGLYAQRMDAGGVPKWSANGVALCTAPSDQLSPSIASDGAGGAIVTWVDDRHSSLTDFDIYAQRVDAA